MSTSRTITAENVTRIFPEVHTQLIGDEEQQQSQTSMRSTTNETNSREDDLAGYDEEQIRLMDEVCIVLDSNDNAIGSASKKSCHLMTNINQGLLHRAFSCFLFDKSTKKLLLQQRAKEKITFPEMWTNTCCSHPLAHPNESGPLKFTGNKEGDLILNVEGAKRAAIRKLYHELGIPSKFLPFENFQFLTRIHYLAKSDGKWGEHEIDYILFIEIEDKEELILEINTNEVKDIKWVNSEELKEMFKKGDIKKDENDEGEEEKKEKGEEQIKYTPWFKLICESMLFEWWDALKKGNLKNYVGDKEIIRMC